MGLADAQNNLAGWCFLRSAQSFWEHKIDAAGIPTIPATDELHVRFHTSPDANLVWVAFTYFCPDDWTASSGDPKVTLSILSGATGFGTTDDAGCVFSNDNGGLLAGFLFGAGEVVFPITGAFATEMGGVQRTASTGFDAIVDTYTTVTDYARPLNVQADTDSVLKILTEDCVVTSAFVCEMYELERF